MGVALSPKRGGMMIQAERLSNSWITWRTRQERASARVYCFHSAGGSAYQFRKWSLSLPSSLEVCALQLPGRHSRLRDAPFVRLEPLVASLVDETGPLLDRPFVFFGHSMGATLAFELARELQRRGMPLPDRILVASRRAPHLPMDAPAMHALPDRDLVEEVQIRYGAIPAGVTASPELLSLVLPALRADVTLSETYEYRVGERLPVPIVAMGGRADAHVAEDALAAWRAHTDRAFALHMLPGGHFFFQDDERHFLRILVDVLAGITDSGKG